MDQKEHANDDFAVSTTFGMQYVYSKDVDEFMNRFKERSLIEKVRFIEKLNKYVYDELYSELSK